MYIFFFTFPKGVSVLPTLIVGFLKMQHESFINKETLKSLKDSLRYSVFQHKITVKWSYSELAFTGKW